MIIVQSTTMKFLLFLLPLILFSTDTDAVECESGWVTYKDEHCIKTFPNLLTYDEAKEFCSSKGNELSPASLVMVKEEAMQELLVNYTHNTYDNIWLGGKYDRDTAQFTWEDGSPLTYTNWQEGYPRNAAHEEPCIELRPTNDHGQWADVVCQKRNLVICQRTVSWTLQDAVLEILRIRKLHREELDVVYNKLDQALEERTDLSGVLQATREDLAATKQRLELTQQNLQSTKTDLQSTQRDLQGAKQNLQSVSARVVPVGSIYIEYHNQPTPRSLWPNFTWQDISSTYAGQFFRVTGGGSSGWGSTQSECSPRITQMTRDQRVSNKPDFGDRFARPLNIPSNGWSEFGDGGEYWRGGGQLWFEGLKFHTQGCEVRPINKAIRIWKRAA